MSIRGSSTAVKAVRLHGNKSLKIDYLSPSMAAPPLKEGQVRLAPAWCGICDTDLNEFVNGPLHIPLPANPHPISGESLPMTLGHEFSATVTEVHPSVSQLRVGSRVAVEPDIGDGTCHMCLLSRPNNCEAFGCMGLTSTGGMTESMVAPAKNCHLLPDNVPLSLGALIEPLSVAWNGIAAAGVKATDTVLVLGTGPIGMVSVLCLRAMGVERILVSGRSPGRNERIKSFGLATVVSSTDDVVGKAKELFDGLGPHVVLDCVASQASFDVGWDAIRKHGTFYTYGQYYEPLSIDANRIFYNALTIKGDLCYTPEVFPAVIAAIADGRIDKNILDSLITARIAMEDVETQGFDQLINNKQRHIKIHVRINGDSDFSKASHL
ncbi:MAG: hypothetical protein M1819_002057 [Sarea resinae]|nr:MAG: hypothetical protein M1819_002057 [Sarea resinae]